jgi:predicted PurR-regulated permease PerM
MALGHDRDRLAALLFYAVLLLLAYLAFRIFQPFLAPLGWAAVIVVVFYPWHARLERRWGPNRAAAASVLLATLVVIVPALMLLTAFVREGVEVVRGLNEAREPGRLSIFEQGQRAWEGLQQRVPMLAAVDAGAVAREVLERVSGFLTTSIGPVLRNVAVLLFDLFLTLFAAFYFFRDAGEMLRGLRRVLPFEEGHREKLIAQARDLIFASVTSSLIVAAVQGLLGGVIFAALGLAGPVFWGVVMGFFSLLPIVGAWVIWVPAAVWLLLNDQVTRGVLLLALGAGVVGTVDNVLRPLLISGRARLNGLLVFISVLGGIGVFGMLGIVLGPILVATVASVLDVYIHPPAAAAEAEPGEVLLRGRNAVLE